MAIEWTHQYDKSEACWKALCEVHHFFFANDPLQSCWSNFFLTCLDGNLFSLQKQMKEIDDAKSKLRTDSIIFEAS